MNIHSSGSEFRDWAFISHGVTTRYERIHKDKEAASVAAYTRMHCATSAHPVTHDGRGMYARVEPTTDAILLAQQPDGMGKRDVALYRDPEAREPIGRYSWWHSRKPTRRNRYIMHNCARYPLSWLPPLA